MTSYRYDISILCEDSNNWEIKNLKTAADKHNLELNLLNLQSLNDWQNSVDKIGKIVFWPLLGFYTHQQGAIFSEMLADRIVFNQAVLKRPFIASNFYQQKMFEKYLKIKGIKTFNYHRWEDLRAAMKKEVLKYPFICKNDLGNQAKDVFLIEKKGDLKLIKDKIKNYIFQNFIENDRSYQVLVFGGKVLGTMRYALKGKPEKVEDKEIIKKLTTIGLKTASSLNLQWCSVDILHDQKKDKYRVITVDINPKWQSLQSVCKLNISEEIVKHCKHLLRRDKYSVPKLVKNQYRMNYRYLSSKKFHYATRHFLWFRHKTDEKSLEKLKKELYTKEKLRQRFKEYLKNREKMNKSCYQLRQTYLNKYPFLKVYTRILFEFLWAEKMFGMNIENLVAEYLSSQELIDLQKRLINDEKALPGLSSSAINFLYLSRYYLGSKSEKISPSYLLKVIQNFEPLDETEIKLKIYYLTHCIIGETLFYMRKLNQNQRKIYQRLAQEVEKVIRDNYFEVTLDNKFEFLVTAKLCGYQSQLRRTIESEAKNSLSDSGNYLVDQLEKTKKTYGDNLVSSEHRNILYLMAMFPRKNNKFKINL